MNYLIIGAGGTGGCIAGYMTKAKKDVTLIARGAHLQAIQDKGLVIQRAKDVLTIPVQAMSEEDYKRSGEKADVILVCVKGYSLESVYPLIKAAAHKDTVVLPILNIYGTGEKMAKKLPDLEVLSGCIYISGEIAEPGVLKQNGDIFRIVYGRVDGDTGNGAFRQIYNDLRDSGITPLLSRNIQRDTFQKYSLISAMAAVGIHNDATAGDIKKEGPVRDMFIEAVREINALAVAMEIPFDADVIQANLELIDGLADEAVASMQRDMEKKKDSEIDGLVFEVVRLGKKYEVPVPLYREIAEKFGFEII